MSSADHARHGEFNLSWTSSLALDFGSAETITVCLDGSCDFTDPAAAVQAAADGDVIEIAAGTYLLDETISLYGPSVDILGAVDGKGRPATILDGQGSRQVLSHAAASGIDPSGRERRDHQWFRRVRRRAVGQGRRASWLSRTA